jgi:DNA polymerase (family 10)
MLAQLLASQGENPYKIRAYRRAAETVRGMSESVADVVNVGADLTRFPGIGQGISAAIREIVVKGSMARVDKLRAEVRPELAALAEYPRLDPQRVLRIYKKLGIGTVAELKQNLESGELGKLCGTRMEQHVREALGERIEILLYDAEIFAATIETFLREKCGVEHVAVAGEVRRKVEIVSVLTFVLQTSDFDHVVTTFRRYGGGAELLASNSRTATFKLSTGGLVTLENSTREQWGIALIVATGATAHLEKLDNVSPGLLRLARSKKKFPSELSVYRALSLEYVEPELREGRDEVERAQRGELPRLVTLDDIRGELHAHSTSSDGVHSIEQMRQRAKAKAYDYLGITDHSQSLKIAGGLSEGDLLKQIRAIDKLNAQSRSCRILKSAEVDILTDGTLDYPDAVLKELDYTICSIHSRFGLTKEKQTERVLRAIDNPYFNILGHATGRLLLRRPGYELDFDRIIAHARQAGTFFEINSSPDRLDLSAEHARLVREAGIRIAICTDAHSVGELDYMRYGVDQARRAGFERGSILNCLSWRELSLALKRSQ